MNSEWVKEILEFIKRRFPQDANWLNGNCYWFAHILCTRFPFLKIYYEPIEGHFYAGTPSHYFDWTGLRTPYSKPILFEEIKETDKLWYDRIIRDCVK